MKTPQQHIGLVVPVRDRAEITRLCLDKLAQADMSSVDIVIVDDGSEQAEVVRYLQDYRHSDESNTVHLLRNESPVGIERALQLGFRRCLELGCTVLSNLDSDAYVNKDFLTRLLALFDTVGDRAGLYTAFNEKTHMELKLFVTHRDGYLLKNAGGGINYLFHRDFYPTIELALTRGVEIQFAWDGLLAQIIRQSFISKVIRKLQRIFNVEIKPLMNLSYRLDRFEIYGLPSSAVQHIGVTGINAATPEIFIKKALYATDYTFDSEAERAQLIERFPVLDGLL